MSNTNYQSWTPSQTPPPPYPDSELPREPLIPPVYLLIGSVVALVVGVLFVALMVYLALNYADIILVLRDMFIIALGLMSCVSGVVLILLLVAIIRLVNMLEYELKPILLRTNETLGTIRGTTTFVSDNVVRPMTTASSYLAGLRQGARTLFGNPRR